MTPAVDEPPQPRQRVAICVCTYKRPPILGRLLERLELVVRDADELAEVVIAIADDDPAGSAAEVARSFAPRFPLGLHHVVSASGNIAIARNRVLELGLEHGDWLAITDDDCMPDEDWLRQLLVVQRAHQADAVSGCCVDEPPPDAPSWLSSEPFLDDFSTGSDGMPIEMGALKNTLVSADFLRRTGIRFDVEFGRSGCEDAMFFYTTHEAGLDLRYAADAVVREKVPPERATLSYQLRRRLWYGNTEAQTAIASGRTTRGRMAASGVKKAVAGAIRPVVRAVRREPPQLRFALSEVLQGVGRVLGSGGVKLESSIAAIPGCRSISWSARRWQTSRAVHVLATAIVSLMSVPIAAPSHP